MILQISLNDLPSDNFLTSSRIFSSSPRMTRLMHSLCETALVILLVFSSQVGQSLQASHLLQAGSARAMVCLVCWLTLYW